MTNRIRDACWIEPIGYGSRHGPYARGEPVIRGKPGSWLQRNSRVLAAEKTDDEVGVFIPNRDWFVEKEAPPNLPQGEEQEETSVRREISSLSCRCGKESLSVIKEENKEDIEYRM